MHRRSLSLAFLGLGLLLVLPVSAAAKTVVSLSPHLTEAVYWLGAGQQLLGRDRYSDNPPQALNVPVVGDAYSVNIEALIQLNPDLVLLWQAPAPLKKQLKRYGLAYFESQAVGITAIHQELTQLAQILEVKASKALADLAQTNQNLLKAYPSHKTAKKAVLLVQANPPIALGNGDSLSQSLPLCGWSNLLEQQQAVVSLNKEYLLTANYDAIVDMSAGELDSLIPSSVLYLQPKDKQLGRPGPYFAAAVQRLCTALNSANAEGNNSKD